MFYTVDRAAPRGMGTLPLGVPVIGTPIGPDASVSTLQTYAGKVAPIAPQGASTFIAPTSRDTATPPPPLVGGGGTTRPPTALERGAEATQDANYVATDIPGEAPPPIPDPDVPPGVDPSRTAVPLFGRTTWWSRPWVILAAGALAGALVGNWAARR